MMAMTSHPAGLISLRSSISAWLDLRKGGNRISARIKPRDIHNARRGIAWDKARRQHNDPEESVQVRHRGSGPCRDFRGGIGSLHSHGDGDPSLSAVCGFLHAVVAARLADPSERPFPCGEGSRLHRGVFRARVFIPPGPYEHLLHEAAQGVDPGLDRFEGGEAGRAVHGWSLAYGSLLSQLLSLNTMSGPPRVLTTAHWTPG